VDAPPEVLAAEPRPLDRRLLLVLLVGVLLGALVLGGFAVVDRLRGGASSPDALADRVVSAVDDEDLGALVRLVEPDERAALVRVSDAWSRRLTTLDLPDAAGGRPPSRTALFDGLDLGLTGATPRVESRAGDVAVVGLGNLIVRVRTHPAQARGLLRALFLHQHLDEPDDRTYSLDDLADLGVRKRLVTVQRSGRWYLSVLGTLLGPGIPEGSIADVRALPPMWSPTPRDAAEATVRALLDPRSRHDVTALAGTLDASGSDFVQLWAAQLVIIGLDRPPAPIATLRTSDGPGDGSRAVVRVGALRVGDGSGFDLAGPCVATNGERACLQRSGYRYAGGLGKLSQLELLGHDGAYSLTAVHGVGGWRTSLPESLADALVAYADGLTREQVLMVLGQERLDAPAGELRTDQPSEVAFTSGGYALRTVHVTAPGLFRVVPSPAGNWAAIYDPDGQPSVQPFFPNDSAYRLQPGDHTLLVWADDAFADTLARPDAAPYVQRVEVRTVR
jgi:hypothetical protein